MPKYVLRAVFGRMQFTLHATRRTPHGASRLVQAMSAWLVRTRRAPSRHGRDARVYIHTTTAIRKLSTPRLPPPPYPVTGRVSRYGREVPILPATAHPLRSYCQVDGCLDEASSVDGMSPAVLCESHIQDGIRRIEHNDRIYGRTR